MAAIREPGKPLAIHVSRTEVGQAPLFRCHSAPSRRISAISGWLRPPGYEAAPVESGLAHSFRKPAATGSADILHHAAQPCLRFECGECRYVMGIYRTLLARRK